MKIAIDIPDKIYKMLTETAIMVTEAYPSTIERALTEGTPYEERKKGKWKTAYLDHVAMSVRPKVLYCSACEQCIAYPTNYCPNCGTKMEVDE